MNHTVEDTLRTDLPTDDAIVLGTASTDTRGGPLVGEEMGGFTLSGISPE